MAVRKLNIEDVARETGASFATVRSWLRPEHQAAHRRIPDKTIDLLEGDAGKLDIILSERELRAALPSTHGFSLGLPATAPKGIGGLASTAIGRALDALARRAGRLPSSGTPVRIPAGRGQILVIGPCRSGKTTAFSARALLDTGIADKGHAPAIVTSDTAELFALTGPARMMGGRRVALIEPSRHIDRAFMNAESRASELLMTSVTTTRWQCNPSDLLDRCRYHFVGSIERMLDEAIPDNGRKDPFWFGDARKGIASLWAWLSDSSAWYDGSPFPAEMRSPAAILDIIALPNNELEALANHLASGAGASIRGFEEVGMGLPRSFGKVLLSLRTRPLQLAGVLGTIRSEMAWCSGDIRQSMSRSGCAIGHMVDGAFVEESFEPFDFQSIWDAGTDVFLVPDQFRQETKAWARMLRVGLLQVIFDNAHRTRGRVFLDVCEDLGILGPMPSLLSHSAIAGGKGVQQILCWQSLGQITEQYGKNGLALLLSNAYAKIITGAAKWDSSARDLIQRHIGGTLTETELSRLGESQKTAVAFISQVPKAILFDKLRYDEDPANFSADGTPIFPVPHPFNQVEIMAWKKARGL